MSASRRPAPRLVIWSNFDVPESTGSLRREKIPVARRLPVEKLLTTPLNPALRKVIGVRVAAISSPTMSERAKSPFWSEEMIRRSKKSVKRPVCLIEELSEMRGWVCRQS